jgi:dihydroorotase
MSTVTDIMAVAGFPERYRHIEIPRWFDRHIHVRDGEMLQTVLPYTLSQRATGAVIMGNLKHPDETSTVEKARAYRERIQHLLPPGSDFVPCMTCYLTDDISPEEVVRGYEQGVWRAVKLYMADQEGKGGTTGSAHGVRHLHGRRKVFEAMEKHGIPLLGHFEAVEAEVDEFDREIVSTDRDVRWLLDQFPKLQVVFEHLTDSRAADVVVDSHSAGAQIYATITAHHLMINRSAMFEGGMNPGHYCKPVPKREWHRARIVEYVTSGKYTCFGAGTDSAPHDESVKSKCYGCAAGIFTAHAAVEMYTTVFAEQNALHHLGPFMSENFLHLYGVQPSSEMMRIENRSLEVPQKVGGVQAFWGGKTLPWKLVG